MNWKHFLIIHISTFSLLCGEVFSDLSKGKKMEREKYLYLRYLDTGNWSSSILVRKWMSREQTFHLSCMEGIDRNMNEKVC